MSGAPALNSAERAVLEAIIARILPSEDGAGAREANVIGYLDWAVEQPFFQPHRRRITSGVTFVDLIAIDCWQKGFVLCSPAEQDAVLRTVEGVPSEFAKRFMATLIDIALAGFLCDPKYGGNRGLVGWKYIGFELGRQL